MRPPEWMDDADRAANDGAIESRVPPHDVDAEAAVVSAVLVDPAALPKVPWLRPEHFYSEAHRRIFEAAVALQAEGKPVDAVLVLTWLRDHERLAQVGGSEYVRRVIDAAPAVVNVGRYAEVVLTKKWRLRQKILLAQRIVAQGYVGVDDEAAVDELATLAAFVPLGGSQKPTAAEPLRRARSPGQGGHRVGAEPAPAAGRHRAAVRLEPDRRRRHDRSHRERPLRG